MNWTVIANLIYENTDLDTYLTFFGLITNKLTVKSAFPLL
jgi:hypothetical protein